MDPAERWEFARTINQANDFGELSPEYQRLIVEAEAERERLIARRRRPRSA
jgi:hypothetical protein